MFERTQALRLQMFEQNMNRFEYDLTVSSCAALAMQSQPRDLNEESFYVFEKEINTEEKNYLHCKVTFSSSIFTAGGLVSL